MTHPRKRRRTSHRAAVAARSDAAAVAIVHSRGNHASRGAAPSYKTAVAAQRVRSDQTAMMENLWGIMKPLTNMTCGHI